MYLSCLRVNAFVILAEGFLDSCEVVLIAGDSGEPELLEAAKPCAPQNPG
jgi:hypothetical protein